MRQEPTATIAAIGAFLSALIKALVLLDIVAWNAEQLAGISLVIDAGLVVIGTILIRQRVTPVESPKLPEGTVVTTTINGSTTGTTTV